METTLCLCSMKDFKNLLKEDVELRGFGTDMILNKLLSKIYESNFIW